MERWITGVFLAWTGSIFDMQIISFVREDGGFPDGRHYDGQYIGDFHTCVLYTLAGGRYVRHAPCSRGGGIYGTYIQSNT